MLNWSKKITSKSQAFTSSKTFPLTVTPLNRKPFILRQSGLFHCFWKQAIKSAWEWQTNKKQAFNEYSLLLLQWPKQKIKPLWKLEACCFSHSESSIKHYSDWIIQRERWVMHHVNSACFFWKLSHLPMHCSVTNTSKPFLNFNLTILNKSEPVAINVATILRLCLKN